MEKRNFNRRYPKEYGFGMSLFYTLFVLCVVIPVSKLMYNLKITGHENIEHHKKYLFTGNHVSFLDPPFVTVAAQHRVAYMAKHELFEDKNPLLRYLVKHLGAFAVNREKPEIATFKTVLDILKTPWRLGIFPQGKIENDNTITTIQKGFVGIAKKAKVDIVPIGICGFDGYAHKLFEKHITLKIGKPISYELEEDEIVRQWLTQICELTGFENKTGIELSEVVKI